MAIEPRTIGEQEKLALALDKIAEEDPTFHSRFDEDSGQTIISGMGELHLEIIADRILREYRIPIKTGRPRSYIGKPLLQPLRLKDYLTVRSMRSNSTATSGSNLNRFPGVRNSFVVNIPEGKIPDTYYPAIEKAFYEATAVGPISGYPLMDIKATLVNAHIMSVIFRNWLQHSHHYGTAGCCRTSPAGAA